MATFSSCVVQFLRGTEWCSSIPFHLMMLVAVDWNEMSLNILRIQTPVFCFIWTARNEKGSLDLLILLVEPPPEIVSVSVSCSVFVSLSLCLYFFTYHMCLCIYCMLSCVRFSVVVNSTKSESEYSQLDSESEDIDLSQPLSSPSP